MSALLFLNIHYHYCGPQVWTHYKIGKLNMWTLFCNICIDFLNSQIWKEIMLELNFLSLQVLPTHSQLIFPSKTWFFWNLFEFSGLYLSHAQYHDDYESIRASPAVLSMWSWTVKLDEDNLTYGGLAQENGFVSA